MKSRSQRGYAALPIVSALGLIFTLSLLMLFKVGLMNRDQMAKAQLRNDYRQREDALMRGLIAVFPQAAINSMKGGFAPSNNYSWSTIFSQAEGIASSSTSLTSDLVTKLNLSNTLNGNSGDTATQQLGTWITSLTGVVGAVTPGTMEYASVFTDPRFAGKVPPLLNAPNALQDADASMPVISLSKYYSTQSTGLMVDVTKYPIYNFIPYPNIRFGYAAPGQPVVAKHNWWAFSVTFGAAGNGKAAPINPVTKYYVLSLYELPSQLPIEAATFTQIGLHQDGTAWDSTAISISGSLYADQLSMTDTFGSSRVAGKQSISLAKTVSLGGTQVTNDFDKAGVREQLQAQSNTDMLPIALTANSGRLAFLPIQRGAQFLQRAADTASTNAWSSYSTGGEQCMVTVKAISMVSLGDQTPTKIQITFKATDGTFKSVTLQRGVNWPTLIQSGGTAIPFQTEYTDSNHACLSFYPTLFNAWLTAQGGATVAVNNSIHFRTDNTADPLTVLPAVSPPIIDDMAIIIRKGQDLTSYTNGFSVVAPLRVYIGDDLNAYPLASAPAGSGLPAGTAYYPPLSIFSAQLRIGTTAVVRLFDHQGQLSTLTNNSSSAWSPVDVKSGSDDAVHTDTITAELSPLSSPANLPPIHQMNWLIVIEEIPQD